jgi:hypothetical protein
MRLIHLTGKHAPEFESRDIRFQPSDILLDGLQGFRIVLIRRNLEQFFGVVQRLAHPIEGQHHLFQACTLAPEFLGVIGVIPDVGVFQLPGDFGQPFAPVIEVKDTP